MHASSRVLAAALLLAATASAVPGATRVVRPRAEATDAWVSVGDDGKPTTVTPVLTTISGTPTVISGAPNDITGSVFTQTNNGEVTTSTGSAPLPTATKTGGAGSFPVCHNKDAKNPICEPTNGSVLNPSKTYYITWDSSVFSGANTTLRVAGSYYNATTGSVTTSAFTSDIMIAGWGFFPWTIDRALLQGASSANISLSLISVSGVTGQKQVSNGLVVTIADPPPYQNKPAQIPQGPALYIGLPTIAGFIILMVVGTALWNRHVRKIGLGNIMSRTRHGYGIGKSRTQRTRRRQAGKAPAIQLMERDVSSIPPEQQYRDRPVATTVASPSQERGAWHEQVPGRNDELRLDLPRRDSDALGSLAGTPPLDDRHGDYFSQGRSHNAFRDEISRQDRQRL